ncbi:hypothetical protein ACC676_09620 [Rhizobium ruizarguesonis]
MMDEKLSPAPVWDSVKRPDHGKRRDETGAEEDQERLQRLADWIELKFAYDVCSSNVPRMWDAEFEALQRNGLTAAERALLLREMEAKRATKGQRRKRSERHFPEIAGALRASPSPRFLRVVADMIELGFFTGKVNLDEDFAVLETAETRKQILEVLTEAYGGVPKNLLAERATDLTPFFRVDRERWERSWADLHKEAQDYKNAANDTERMRVAHLLHSIRQNIWPQGK